MTKVVVIGGGISGLTSAYFLSQQIDPRDITVIESDDHLGGTVSAVEFGSHLAETGPDSFITRNPSAIDLAADLHLSERLISPATNSAFIYSRSALHPIPSGTVFGAPSDFNKFFGNSLLSKTGQLRAAMEPLLGHAKIQGDTTVGSFAKKRWGKEVTDRLIEPLVGGIHAGTVYELSLAQCAPQYLDAAQTKRSVSKGLRSQMANYTPSGHPMFYSLEGGLSGLVDGLVSLLEERNVEILTRCESAEIRPLADGYRITTEKRSFDAEGIICATPAFVASRLLKAVSSTASELLDTIDYASPIMTLLGYEDASFGEPLRGSGVLVPRQNKTLTTAITFATNKWPGWKSEGETILRVSAGRIGDNRVWEFDDRSLVATLEAEMTKILGVRSRSIRSKVARWQKRIPQFKPYHAQLIQRIRESLPSGVELAGAPFLGVGIPACISSASLAADRLVKTLSKPR